MANTKTKSLVSFWLETYIKTFLEELAAKKRISSAQLLRDIIQKDSEVQPCLRTQDLK